MKHIKLYENFISLFRKLSISDAKRSYQDRGGYEKFTDSEIERIKDVMKNRGELLPELLPKKEIDVVNQNGFTRGKVRYEVNWHKQRDKSCRLEINKGKDEYFYIRKESMSEWYECDTIDGLIECLKTLI